MLDAVLLPEGTKLTANICRMSTVECMDRAVIDETFAVLPSIIAYDMSYMQYYAVFQDVNVSLTFSGGNERLLVAAEVVSCAGNCTDYTMAFEGNTAWLPLRSGSGRQVSDAQMTIDATGLRSTDFFLSTDSTPVSPVSPEMPGDTTASPRTPTPRTPPPYAELVVALEYGVPVGISTGDFVTA